MRIINNLMKKSKDQKHTIHKSYEKLLRFVLEIYEKNQPSKLQINELCLLSNDIQEELVTMIIKSIKKKVKQGTKTMLKTYLLWTDKKSEKLLRQEYEQQYGMLMSLFQFQFAEIANRAKNRIRQVVAEEYLRNGSKVVVKFLNRYKRKNSEQLEYISLFLHYQMQIFTKGISPNQLTEYADEHRKQLWKILEGEKSRIETKGHLTKKEETIDKSSEANREVYGKEEQSQNSQQMKMNQDHSQLTHRERVPYPYE